MRERNGSYDGAPLRSGLAEEEAGMSADAGVAALTNTELVHLHNLTEEIANLCRSRLRSCLDALAPLFRPRRVLGDLIEGATRESVPEAEKNFTELKETYRHVSGRPFDLRRELSAPLESIPTQIQLYEWEYVHQARTQNDRRQITVVSPLTWVLAYPSVYSLSMMRQVMAGKQERDHESVRAFVVRACVMQLLFSKQAGLVEIFEGLRYRVQVRKRPELGELPLVTVSAPVSTMRPADELILAATGLSGRAGFQEILDTASVAAISDPFDQQLKRILGEHQESGR